MNIVSIGVNVIPVLPHDVVGVAGVVQTDGVTQLMEVGSGKVLSGLARRINRELASVNVGSMDDLDKALEAIA